MPEDMNIIVSSLPEYVEQNRDTILRYIVLGGTTIRHMVPQTGIKTKAAINYLDVDPKFQDGRSCKFTPQSGGIELTQREIETGIIKVELEVCPDTLLGKYAEYLVRIDANEQDFPFERYILDSIVNKINYKLEKAIWQGDKSSSDGDLNKFDGLLKLAASESETVTVEFAENATAWEKIKAMILALPDEALDQEGKTAVFVGTDVFRNFMLEVVEKNFFHYSGAQNDAPKEFVFPGTDTVVVSTPGLSRTGIMYATYERNLYYGCDMMEAKEEVRVIWDEKDGVFAVKCKWNSGVQTAFPNLVVVGGPAGSTEVTISGANSLNVTAGAGSNDRTYATSDGSNILASVEGDDPWLSVSVAENGKTVTFTREAQEAGSAQRTATVLLTTATGGSKQVTVTQAAAE